MALFRGYAAGSFYSVDGFTYNYTVPAGNDRAIVFFVNIDGSESFSQLSYNGSTCSLISRIKESTSSFDIASEAWYLKLGSGAEITTGLLAATSASGSMGIVGLFAVDLTGIAQDTTVGSSAGTQNLGTSESTAIVDITTLYNNSLLLVNCSGQGGDYDPWTSIGSLTDTFNGDTGTSTLTDIGFYLGYRTAATAGLYTVGAVGAVNDENVVLAVELRDSGSSGNATATPSLITQTLLVNTSTQALSKSQIATPSLIEASLTVNTSVIAYSLSQSVSTSLIELSLSVLTPTVSYTRSSFVSVSSVSLSLIVNASSASSGSGINATASPGVVDVSFTVGTHEEIFSRSSIASATIVNASLSVETASASANGGVNATATPSLLQVSLISGSHQESFSSSQSVVATVTVASLVIGSSTAISSATATPSLVSINFLVNASTASSSGSQSQVATPSLISLRFYVYEVSLTAGLLDIFLDSRMEKELVLNSQFGSTEE